MMMMCARGTVTICFSYAHTQQTDFILFTRKITLWVYVPWCKMADKFYLLYILYDCSRKYCYLCVLCCCRPPSHRIIINASIPRVISRGTLRWSYARFGPAATAPRGRLHKMCVGALSLYIVLWRRRRILLCFMWFTTCVCVCVCVS